MPTPTKPTRLRVSERRPVIVDRLPTTYERERYTRKDNVLLVVSAIAALIIGWAVLVLVIVTFG